MEIEKRDRKIGVFAILRDGVVLKWLSVLAFCWFVQSLTYYSLSQMGDAISGTMHFYLAFLLLAFVEVPAVFLLTIVMRFIGRRVLYSGSFAIAGLLCFAAIAFQPKSAGIAVTAILARGVISMTFALAYIYTAEVVPTVGRGMGIGICSLFARLGGMASPFVIGWVSR